MRAGYMCSAFGACARVGPSTAENGWSLRLNDMISDYETRYWDRPKKHHQTRFSGDG